MHSGSKLLATERWDHSFYLSHAFFLCQPWYWRHVHRLLRFLISEQIQLESGCGKWFVVVLLGLDCLMW